MKLTTKQHETGLKLQLQDLPAEDASVAEAPDTELSQRAPNKDHMGTAEILSVEETAPRVFRVEVRCPYCMCLHAHHVNAADLDELRTFDEVLRRRHCDLVGLTIMGVPEKSDLLAYKLRGFADLDDDGWHSDLESADPHGFFFDGPYDAPARITAAVSLIRAAPGLTGFDIEHFRPTPAAKLVRHGHDGVQRDVLMLSVQPADLDEPGVLSLEGCLQLVLQRHRLIGDRFSHAAQHDVPTYDDPGHLLRAVYAWLNATPPQTA